MLGVALLSWMKPSGAREADPAEEVLSSTVRTRPEPAARRGVHDPKRRKSKPAWVEPEAVAAAAAPADEALSVVIVDVVDDDGRPAEDVTVVPIRCEGFGGGPPGEYVVPPGSCALRAVRRDGALTARGPIETVAVGGPDPAYIQLVLTGRRTGGIGVRFLPTAEGMRVLNVVPGTPAYEAGLAEGDLILAVGGVDVGEMGSEEFVERMTGAEGTDVEFTLGLQSDTGVSEETLRVTRAFLEG